jgi:hypothetical protein
MKQAIIPVVLLALSHAVSSSAQSDKQQIIDQMNQIIRDDQASIIYENTLTVKPLMNDDEPTVNYSTEEVFFGQKLGYDGGHLTFHMGVYSGDARYCNEDWVLNVMNSDDVCSAATGLPNKDKQPWFFASLNCAVDPNKIAGVELFDEKRRKYGFADIFEDDVKRLNGKLYGLTFKESGSSKDITTDMCISDQGGSPTITNGEKEGYFDIFVSTRQKAELLYGLAQLLLQ